MLKITMLDTTGRAPVALFSVIAASAQVRTEFLEIHVADPMQDTILRGKLIEYAVTYATRTVDPMEVFTIDLERTDFEFRAEADNSQLRAVITVFDEQSSRLREASGNSIRFLMVEESIDAARKFLAQ